KLFGFQKKWSEALSTSVFHFVVTKYRN
ncbi:hypothetical protein TIFTF001_029993, partial [Ficus carica]